MSACRSDTSFYEKKKKKKKKRGRFSVLPKGIVFQPAWLFNYTYHTWALVMTLGIRGLQLADHLQETTQTNKQTNKQH